jgi:hypothetical protein
VQTYNKRTAETKQQKQQKQKKENKQTMGKFIDKKLFEALK